MTVSPSKRRMSASIARLVAVAALALGGLVVAGTAGAQGYDSGGADAGADGGSPPGGDTRNCTEIKEQTGRINIPKTDPLYRIDLDDNKDGIACEGDEPGGTSGSSSTGGTTGVAPSGVVPIASPGATGGGTTGVAPAAYPVVSGTAQAPYAGQLGNTGTSASTIAIVAAAVVLVGSALVLGARRRKQV